MFYTYILFSSKYSRFYIGQTDIISKRLERHNSGYVLSTKPFRPLELVGYIEKVSRTEALILERNLKNFNTEDLKKFIKKYFNKNF